MELRREKNSIAYLVFPMLDSADTTAYKTGETVTDTAYYKDGAGAWTSLAITDTVAEIGSTGMYELDLSASEMNHDKIIIKLTATNSTDTAILINTVPQVANVTQWDDTAVTGDGDWAELQTDVDAILVDTGTTIPADLATIDSNVDAILVDTGTTLPATLTTIEGKIDTVDTNVDAVLVDTGTTIPAQITALNDISTAQVNIEVDTALGDFFTSSAQLVDDIWDEALTSGTHDVADSSGRRLRILQSDDGYNGAIWIDTVNGTSGTTDFENGTATNPVSSIADAMTLSASLKIGTFHVAPNSNITLTASVADKFFIGNNWTIALGGQDIARSYIQGASLSGIGTGAGYKFVECIIGTSSLADGALSSCGLAGQVTLTDAGDYFWECCYSGIAGTSTPSVDFESSAEVKNLNARHYSGGIEAKNLGAGGGTHNMSLEGNGQLVINTSCAGGTIAIRGNFGPITDNASQAVTLVELGNITSLQGDSYGATTFDRTTDALEAIRDRGDSAWISGAGITQQDVRDAMKLAPTGGAPSAGSVDEHLDDILVDTGTTIPADIATVDTVVDAIKLVTDNLPESGALTTIDSNIDAILVDTGTTLPATLTTIEGKVDTVDSNVDAIKLSTDNLPDGVKKNTALSNFEFLMIDSSDDVSGKTGLTVTAERSIDGAAFSACANAVSEVSAGVYKIDLATTDLNGDVITFKFSGSGANTSFYTIKTDT